MSQGRGEVPRQVPAAPRRFVNRDAELSQAADLITAEHAAVGRITVFSGLPGVGKSATVRRLVERVGASFSGGHLYVDYAQLQDPSGAAAVDDALASCLRGLGVADEVMPRTLTERASLYRTRTAERPVLVVLEDVTEPAQVVPLVPNSVGSAVLVTSIDRLAELTLEDAQPIPLEPLDSRSSTDLLVTLCGQARISAEAVAAERLVELCGGLPIALRVAAARLVARPRLTLASLVEEIARGLDAFSIRGQAVVTAVFTAAYRSLPGDAARMYRRLGLVPGPGFSIELAAVAADVPIEVAGELVEQLAEAGLVMADGLRRFRMHSLIRQHAAELVQAEESELEQDAALLRMVRFLVVHAAFADRAVMGEGRLRCTDHAVVLTGHVDPFDGPDRKVRALDWLDAERANLLAAMRIAVDHEWGEEAWQLAEAATTLYVSRRYLADWVEATELGVRAARRCGRPDVDARLVSFASRAYMDLGDLDRAKEALDYALPLARQSGNQRLVASIWELIGRYHDRGDNTAAVAAYRQAIALFTQAQDDRGVAFVTYFLGCSLDSAGQHEESLVVLRAAVAAVRQVGDERMAGRALTAIADAQSHLGQLVEAKATVAEAIESLSAGGYWHYEAQAQLTLSGIAARDGDRATEVAAVRRALEIHAAAGSPRTESLRARLAGLTDRTEG